MKKNLILTILVMAVLAGCKNNSNSPRGVVSRNTGNGVVSPVFGAGVACANGQSNIGTIYDQSGGFGLGTTSFQDRVKALLSASVNPAEIGTISSGPTDTTGVRFQGVIKVDSAGQVTLASTRMKILVYDSYVLESQYSTNGQKYEPIPIEFTSAVEGRFDSTGSGFVLFRDQYGEIRFEGRFDAQYFSGTVSFRNTQAVGGGTAAQGTLGQFYVARCGIIQ